MSSQIYLGSQGFWSLGQAVLNLFLFVMFYVLYVLSPQLLQLFKRML